MPDILRCCARRKGHAVVLTNSDHGTCSVTTLTTVSRECSTAWCTPGRHEGRRGRGEEGEGGGGGSGEEGEGGTRGKGGRGERGV